MRNKTAKILQEIDFCYFPVVHAEFISPCVEAVFAGINQSDDKRLVLQAVAYFNKLTEKSFVIEVFHRVRQTVAHTVFVATIQTFEKDVGDKFVLIDVIARVFKMSRYLCKSVLTKA